MTCGSSDFGVYRTCYFWKFPNLEISRNGYCSARVNPFPRRSLTFGRTLTRFPAAFPAETCDGTGRIRTLSSSSFRQGAPRRLSWTVRVPAKSKERGKLRPPRFRPRRSSRVPLKEPGKLGGSSGGGAVPRRARWWKTRRAQALS